MATKTLSQSAHCKLLPADFLVSGSRRFLATGGVCGVGDDISEDSEKSRFRLGVLYCRLYGLSCRDKGVALREDECAAGDGSGVLGADETE